MTFKIDKICPRPAEFSLRFPKSDRLLEEIFPPIGEVTFIPVYELGQEKNCQSRSNIAGEQPLAAYSLSRNFLQFSRRYVIEIYYRIDYFEEVIADQKVPGKELPLHNPQEQVKTQDAVGKYDQPGGRAGINLSQERKRIAVGGSGNQKKEEIQSAQKVQAEWAANFVIFSFRHKIPGPDPDKPGRAGTVKQPCPFTGIRHQMTEDHRRLQAALRR